MTTAPPISRVMMADLHKHLALEFSFLLSLWAASLRYD
jgi:hypothetical protein